MRKLGSRTNISGRRREPYPAAISRECADAREGRLCLPVTAEELGLLKLHFGDLIDDALRENPP